MSAQATTPLFSLPIASLEKNDQEGQLVATQPVDKVYLLKFQAGGDNRLTSVSDCFLPFFFSSFCLKVGRVRVDGVGIGLLGPLAWLEGSGSGF